MTVEERLSALEGAFEEIKTLKGIPGPRGGAGDISAALANTERATGAAIVELRKIVADSEARIHSEVANALGVFKANLDQLREDIRKHRDSVRDELNANQKFVRETVEAAVDGQVIQTLHDYKLLKDGAPSADYFRHEFEPAKKS